MEHIQVMRAIHWSMREKMGVSNELTNSLSGEANFCVPEYLLMPGGVDKYTDVAGRLSEPSAQRSLPSSDLVLEIVKDTDDAKYSE